MSCIGESTLVAGNFDSSVPFGLGDPNEITLTSTGNSDGFVAKYNAAGTLAWAKQIQGPGWEVVNSVDSLANGSFVLTGSFSDNAVFGPGEPNETTLSTGGLQGIFVASYGAGGALTWVVPVVLTSGTSNQIRMAADGSSWISGSINQPGTFGLGEPNETTINGVATEAFLARYNPAGFLSWVKSAGGAENDYGTGLAVSSDETTIVVSGSHNVTATFGPGEPNETTLTSAGGEDIWVLTVLDTTP